jgi:cytochrome c556
MRRLAVTALAFVGVSLAASVSAQSPTEIVKARQDLMESIWPKYFRPLVAIVRDQSTDTAQIPTLTAGAVESLKTFAKLVPPGTDKAAVPTSRARPEVWSDKAEFDAKLQALITETEKLTDVAKTGGLDQVKAQIRKAMEACGGCHSGNPKEGGKFRFEATS